MKKFVEFFKNIDVRHYVCVLLTVGILLISVFCFRPSYLRIGVAFNDFGNSFVHYFSFVFQIEEETVPPTITENNDDTVDKGDVAIPDNANSFKAKTVAWGNKFIQMDNFLSYLSFISSSVSFIIIALTLIIPILFLIFILLKMNVRFIPSKSADSVPLRVWKKFTQKVYTPIKRPIISLFEFLKDNSIYYKIWLVIALISFNICSIIISFISYVLYFVVSFDFASIYMQFYKLFVDLVVLKKVPIIFWVGLAFLFFLHYRKKIGYARMNHREFMNRGFINSLPIVFMILGTMGKNKTTMLTDMALSQCAMFRDNAQKFMCKIDLHFPQFPWINLEREIDSLVDVHKIFNLASCRRYIKDVARMFELVNFNEVGNKGYFKRHNHKNDIDKIKYPEHCFGYDFAQYGTYFDNKLCNVYLFDDLEEYAQLYMIYSMSSSLIVSNYSIREDSRHTSNGNFPLWDNDFFHKDSKFQKYTSHYSHILNFDSLRLGKRIDENNKFNNSFEFGVVAITEGGKERGNQLDMQGIKRNDEETNQKNDRFNTWLKLVRHSATVCHEPFVKVCMDEQRAMSMGADVRELCQLVDIDSKGDFELLMPFFYVEELAYAFITSKFFSTYYKFRNETSNNTLFMNAFKYVASHISNYYDRIYNTFSCCEMKLKVQNGAMDAMPDNAKYFLMKKKIYSNRFTTDAFSDYFAEKSMQSSVGICDVPCFNSSKATFDELRKENSYFINDIDTFMDSTDNNSRVVTNTVSGGIHKLVNDNYLHFLKVKQRDKISQTDEASKE